MSLRGQPIGKALGLPSEERGMDPLIRKEIAYSRAVGKTTSFCTITSKKKQKKQKKKKNKKQNSSLPTFL